jgi:hypothetical protein
VRSIGSTRLQLAHHEAGHAVVALMLGYEVNSVTIVADEDAEGRVVYETPLVELEKMLGGLDPSYIDLDDARGLAWCSSRGMRSSSISPARRGCRDPAATSSPPRHENPQRKRRCRYPRADRLFRDRDKGPTIERTSSLVGYERAGEPIGIEDDEADA